MDINQNRSTTIMKDFDRASIIGQLDQKLEEKSLKEVEIIRTDDDFLIELYRIHGNKWDKISSHYIDRDGFAVKNLFYSLLRKCLKKLNTYIKLTSDSTNQSKLIGTNEWAKLLYLASQERFQIFRTNIYESKIYIYFDLLYAFLNLHRENFFKDSSFESLQDQNSLKGLQNSKFDRMIQSLRGIKYFVWEQKENKKKIPKLGFSKKLRIRRKSSPKPSDLNQATIEETNSKSQKSKPLSSNQDSSQKTAQSQRLQFLSN